MATSIINPSNPIVHEIFTPTQKDIIFAEKVVKEIDSKRLWASASSPWTGR